MKILTMLGIGVLATGLGCQSTETQVTKAADVGTETQRVADNKTVATADDHSHEESGDAAAPRIALEGAKEAFDKGEAVFVDTRGSSFYENEHVKGAVNIPAADFEKSYKSVPKDKKIIAYCS